MEYTQLEARINHQRKTIENKLHSLSHSKRAITSALSIATGLQNLSSAHPTSSQSKNHPKNESVDSLAEIKTGNKKQHRPVDNLRIHASTQSITTSTITDLPPVPQGPPTSKAVSRHVKPSFAHIKPFAETDEDTFYSTTKQYQAVSLPPLSAPPIHIPKRKKYWLTNFFFKFSF